MLLRMAVRVTVTLTQGNKGKYNVDLTLFHERLKTSRNMVIDKHDGFVLMYSCLDYINNNNNDNYKK